MRALLDVSTLKELKERGREERYADLCRASDERKAKANAEADKRCAWEVWTTTNQCTPVRRK